MTACTIDEAVRRLIAVGGNITHIGGVDNFCWPAIGYHPEDNPDGKHKAAQLVRACWALRDICLAYGIPLLSGKDSMYVDGYLTGRYGLAHKVSALETMQFSTIGVIEDVGLCTTMDSKVSGDRVYVLGTTTNELGGSEYYEHLGYVGLQVPQVAPERFIPLYKALAEAIKMGLVASAHGVYRGGLGVHLALTAMAGGLGMAVDLARIPTNCPVRNDHLLFSESAGRFIVTVSPENAQRFESLFQNCACSCVGEITHDPQLVLYGENAKIVVQVPVDALRSAWKKPFGELI
jgi:phosphoribosylformylglycinamidine synthase